MWIFSQLFRRSSLKRGFTRHNAGFTLIEMLIVMGIMIVVTTAMLFNQSRFDSSTVLRSLAYGVALSVRQAQVYGTSVVGTSTTQVACGSGYYNTVTGDCYVSAYGLYFSTTLSNTVPSSYALFADLNGDGQYQPNELVKYFYLPKGYTISNFCANGTNLGSGISRCEPASISSLAIVFKRPNPDAQFVALVGDPVTGTPIANDAYANAYIQIQSLANAANTKSVTVTVPGEVSVCVNGTSC